MSWYADLGRVTLIDSGDYVRAIGWLSEHHAFAQGPVPEGWLGHLKTFTALWQASTQALGWGFCMGPHTCELCHHYLAAGNFGVPDGDLLYVVPEMLPHYVEAHGYQPPQAFITALMASPLPGTDAYDLAVAGFKAKHAKHLERQFERIYAEAARWAASQGGDEAALSAACQRFFAADIPEIRARIQTALKTSIPTSTTTSKTISNAVIITKTSSSSIQEFIS